MDKTIELPPLITADSFRAHKEDSDQYAELYLHIAKQLKNNLGWATWHPQAVNKLPLDDNLPTYGSKLGSIGWDDQWNLAKGNLLVKGITIFVAPFETRIVKRVVADLIKAGYNVSYMFGNFQVTENCQNVQDVEENEKPCTINITL